MKTSYDSERERKNPVGHKNPVDLEPFVYFFKK